MNLKIDKRLYTEEQVAEVCEGIEYHISRKCKLVEDLKTAFNEVPQADRINLYGDVQEDSRSFTYDLIYEVLDEMQYHGNLNDIFLEKIDEMLESFATTNEEIHRFNLKVDVCKAMQLNDPKNDYDFLCKLGQRNHDRVVEDLVGYAENWINDFNYSLSSAPPLTAKTVMGSEPTITTDPSMDM